MTTAIRHIRPHPAAALVALLLAYASLHAADPPEENKPMQPTTTTAPRHANRLARATSPYLLQHAHNPVDWYEWGPEALEKSKKENKPIFLSIGYSACHWCHVMERESFENEDIAAVLNRHFVNIKVDREERPDIDDTYMKATVLYNRGQGGWPMSVFLTPDLKPFFAGTYFPPESRYGRPGFKDLATRIAELWQTERDRVLAGADELTGAVRQYLTVQPGDQIVGHETLARAVATLSGAFDPVRGGISGGGTNKFPPSMAMDLMLRAYHFSLEPDDGGKRQPQTRLRELVELTLDHMARGGIYDQLGGGIHRYSTDVEWLAPHFEKMLYDQALVTGIYLDAYQLTGNKQYARVAADICDYVIADLQSPRGGYDSTRDADSEGEEGRYYVWSKQEVLAVLGPEDGELFCSYYDVSDAGNWEGRNILRVLRSAEQVAKLHKISESELLRRLDAARAKLLAVRAKRVEPHLDDKVLSAWNGLMIASMARAGCILNEPRYLDSANRAADFVLEHLHRDGRLLRTWRADVAHTKGYLEDYAFMIEALLNLYEAAFDLRRLDQAVRLNDEVLKHFRDAKDGAFFFTADDAEQVLVRSKDAGDGATPSGNSVQVMNLLRLSVMLDRKDLAKEAERSLRCFRHQMEQNPYSSERMLAALDFYHRRPREIVLLADQTGEDFDALVRTTWETYVPNRVVVGAVGRDAARAAAAKIPLLDKRGTIKGQATAYVCENFVCKAPTTSPEELKKQLQP
jgi:uncharacterized protein YyaL (SSP411 family)